MRQELSMEEGVVPQARVICTLGMHRSGTSLVSRILNLLGVHLGPAPAISASGTDNVKGYWEHVPLTMLSEEILARFGGRWDDPPTFPAGWIHDPRVSDLRDRARTILAEDFSAAPLWGWKDPRSGLTLPFWQDLIGPMRYVICVRNPSAVAASLTRRDRFTVEHADRLWLSYTHALLAQTSGQSRLFVFYEDLMEDTLPTVRRLAAFIGHPERAEDACVQRMVGEFQEGELCHHRMSTEDLADDQGISYATKGLYLAIKGLAPRETDTGNATRAHRALDILGTRALETWHHTARLVAERDALARERETQAESISALTAQRDAIIVDRQAHADLIGTLHADREALFHERQAHADLIGALTIERDALARDRRADTETIGVMTTERDALTRERQAQAEAIADLTAERDEQSVREQRLHQSIAHLEAGLRAARAEANERRATQQLLDEIQTSVAWRLVTFGRRIMGQLMPEGTARRRAVTAILRRMSRRLPSSGSDSHVVDLRRAA